MKEDKLESSFIDEIDHIISVTMKGDPFFLGGLVHTDVNGIHWVASLVESSEINELQNEGFREDSLSVAKKSMFWGQECNGGFEPIAKSS